MSYNIVFKISKDVIAINKIKRDVDYKSLNNTNVIQVKDLKFSNDYIIENFELVSNFLNVIIIKHGVTKCVINDKETESLILDLVNTWEHITKIVFKDDTKLTLDVFMKLADNPYITEVECYEMPPYYIERLDINQKIKVKTRNKYEYHSNFMKENYLNNYSDIYFKKVVIIDTELEDYELSEFEDFIAINNKLKQVRIINYSNEILATVIGFLYKYHKTNVQIIVFEKNNDLRVIYKSIDYLKKNYKKYIEESNIRFKIKYSKEYKRKYFFTELNYKFISTIIILVVVISGICIGINSYKQYKDKLSIANQLNELTDLFDRNSTLTIDDNKNDVDIIDANASVTTTTKRYSGGGTSAYYTNYSQVFDELLKKNDQTVGWIQINNTKVNYPIVQAGDNNFYLNHDFNKRKNTMGWIYMDYRNSNKNLSSNTIIYGHNINAGIMFGTLVNALYPRWYNKEQNRIISFNTPYANMKWQIFSIYKIKTTTDYLDSEFDNDTSFQNFIDLIKGRSINNFGVSVTPEDKILTLSTCANNTSKIVIHAKLIETKPVGVQENVVDNSNTTEETTEAVTESTTQENNE
jgi:sortase B